MRIAMVISPHADDAAAFCGATLAKFADQGWCVVLVRVTDDAKDAVGLTVEEAKRRNTAELHRAAEILGVSEVVELGYETDCLADVSEVALRERIVYLFRKYRPYAVFTFDPFGLYEGNLDHIRVAQAVEEAFWVSRFDLHHPEHFDEGLEPFAVCEHWYFGRHLPEANHAEDISEYMEQKIEALCAHRTMMQNTMNQYRLQLQTWGRHVEWLESSMAEGGDMRPLLGLFLQEQANGVAEAFGMDPGRMGEAFRPPGRRSNWSTSSRRTWASGFESWDTITCARGLSTSSLPPRSSARDTRNWSPGCSPLRICWSSLSTDMTYSATSAATGPRRKAVAPPVGGTRSRRTRQCWRTWGCAQER
jgi:LmbE family N-acetylglucosaminyl deacetylase